MIPGIFLFRAARLGVFTEAWAKRLPEPANCFLTKPKTPDKLRAESGTKILKIQRQ